MKKSIKLKRTIPLTLAASFVMLGAGQQAFAAKFCGDRPSVTWGGGATIEGDLTADECLEIGAGEFGNEDEYAGTGINMNLLAGSKMSVIGYFKDSTVHGASDGQPRAEVWVSKDYKIAWDDYDPLAPATASNININGGFINVLDGGTLKDSFVNEGGLVYITNTGTNNAGDPTNDPGISLNNTVNNGGKLYAYLGGKSEGTLINNGGIEYVQQEGTSLNTVIENGGKQFLQSQGVATSTQIKDGGLQQITSNGLAQNTVIQAGGKQNVVNLGVANGAVVYGTQTVFTNTAAGTATNTKVYGNGAQVVQGAGSKATGVELYANATQSISKNATAENVTINDSAKSTLSSGAQLLGATQINGAGQLSLNATQGSNGVFAESVHLNGADATVRIIAGTSDEDSTRIDRLAGDGKVQFITASTRSAPAYSQLNVDSLSGSMHFYFNTSIQDGRGDYLTVNQGTGQHRVSVADSGVEITQPGDTTLDLITDRSSGAGFNLADLNGANINAVDGGTYMYYLGNRDEAGTGKVWYLYGAAPNPGNPNPPVDPGNPTAPVDPTNPVTPVAPGGSGQTTPSTDAVLAMASAPVIMFNNEMNNLRFRRGELKTSEGNAGVWGRIIGNKNKIDADHAQFKLEQSGFEFGVDKMVDHQNGKAFYGVTGSYDNGSVKHQRGGTSKIDSFGVGAYATYLDQSGLYVDGVVKYNRFHNDVKAVSTNGLGISGDYTQGAMGASVEVGYNIAVTDAAWAEPYGKLSYVRVGSAATTLNNGMKAEIDAQNSMTSELGVSVGKNFIINGKDTVTPYVKAAWVHEYTSNNSTTINRVNEFTTNLSGDSARVGLGINANLLSNKLSVFGELNYGKGNKIDAPVMFNMGLRYNF